MLHSVENYSMNLILLFQIEVSIFRLPITTIYIFYFRCYQSVLFACFSPYYQCYCYCYRIFNSQRFPLIIQSGWHSFAFSHSSSFCNCTLTVFAKLTSLDDRYRILCVPHKQKLYSWSNGTAKAMQIYSHIAWDSFPHSRMNVRITSYLIISNNELRPNSGKYWKRSHFISIPIWNFKWLIGTIFVFVTTGIQCLSVYTRHDISHTHGPSHTIVWDFSLTFFGSPPLRCEFANLSPR